MRRSSLKRFVALAMMISMLACEFVAFGAPTDEKTEDVTVTDTDKADKTTGDTEEDSVNNEYINEMIEKNYTKVSSKYTYPKYTGNQIVYKISDIYVDGGTLTDEINGYDSFTGEEVDKVVQLEYGDTVTVKLDVEKKGQYVYA